MMVGKNNAKYSPYPCAPIRPKANTMAGDYQVLIIQVFKSLGRSPATFWICQAHCQFGAGVPPHTSYQVVKDQESQEQNKRENLIITDQQWNVIYRLKRGLIQRFSEKTTTLEHVICAHKGSLLFILSAQKQKDFYSLLLLKSAQSQVFLFLLYFWGGQREPTPLFCRIEMAV